MQPPPRGGVAFTLSSRPILWLPDAVDARAQFLIYYAPLASGGILKWSTRADCKSAGLRLPRFESLPHHHSPNPCKYRGLRVLRGFVPCSVLLCVIVSFCCKQYHLNTTSFENPNTLNFSPVLVLPRIFSTSRQFSPKKINNSKQYHLAAKQYHLAADQRQPLVFAPWRVRVFGAVSFLSGAFLALLCRLWRGLFLSAFAHDQQRAAPISNGPHDLRPTISTRATAGRSRRRQCVRAISPEVATARIRAVARPRVRRGVFPVRRVPRAPVPPVVGSVPVRVGRSRRARSPANRRTATGRTISPEGLPRPFAFAPRPRSATGRTISPRLCVFIHNRRF